MLFIVVKNTIMHNRFQFTELNLVHMRKAKLDRMLGHNSQ